VGLVSLGLAVLGVIDVIIKAGQAVESRVSNACHIEEHLYKY
jgi:hypothetical protein